MNSATNHEFFVRRKICENRKLNLPIQPSTAVLPGLELNLLFCSELALVLHKPIDLKITGACGKKNRIPPKLYPFETHSADQKGAMATALCQSMPYAMNLCHLRHQEYVRNRA